MSAFAPATSTFSAPAFSFSSTTPAFAPTTTSAFGQNTFSFAPKPALTAPTMSAFPAPTAAAAPSQFGFQSFSFTSAASTLPGAAAVQQPTVCSLEKLHAAVSCPRVYGDERDTILAKFNQLLAYWGTGKGYYTNAPNEPPVEFTEENPFCRFKFVAYSCMSLAKPESGHYSLIFNKSLKEFEPLRQQVLDQLFRILGSKPNISVCVHFVRSYLEQQIELVFYVTEKSPTGTSRNMLPSELDLYFSQQAIKAQLNVMGVVSMFPRTSLTKELLQYHLEHPPMGIDPFIWRQGVLDNPNPDKLVPVPVVGFSGLRQRIMYQSQEASEQQCRLGIISKDLMDLAKKQVSTLSVITERKKKLYELQRRILRAMCKLEVDRKMGLGVQIEEEEFRIKLEAMESELNAPNAFKGRLGELGSNIKMMNCVGTTNFESYSIDEDAKAIIKDHLHVQQQGITHLMDILKEDLKDLKTIVKILKEAPTRS